MADTKISNLTDGSPLQSTDDIPVARSGTNRRVRINLADYATAAQGSTADTALQPGDIDTLAELNALIADATLIDTTDSRLSDARTPTAHAASHATGGSDALTPAAIGAATAAQGSTADSAVQPGDLATVATTGAYADLSGTPTIPSALSDLSDADTTGVQDGDALIYVAANNRFEPGSASGGDFLADGSVPMTGEFVTTPGTFESQVADGATAVAYTFDTTNNLATSGAKLASWKNQGVQKAYIDKDGVVFATQGSSSAPGYRFVGDTIANRGIYRSGGSVVIQNALASFQFDNSGGFIGSGGFIEGFTWNRFSRTSDFTVNGSFRHYDNNGATGTVIFSLPVGGPGYQARITRIASYSVEIEPPAGETIGYPSIALSSDQHLQLDTDYSTVTLERIAGRWVVVASIGTITAV